jgi:hypothetical protein
MLGAPKRTVR